MASSGWDASNYAETVSGWQPEERGLFAGLLGGTFQALDRLGTHDEEGIRKTSHELSVWQLVRSKSHFFWSLHALVCALMRMSAPRLHLVLGHFMLFLGTNGHRHIIFGPN